MQRINPFSFLRISPVVNITGNNLVSQNGTIWQIINKNLNPCGHAANHNILHVCPGPAHHAIHWINIGSPFSAYRVLFDEPMMCHVRACTEVECKHIKGEHWSLFLQELEIFLGLFVARGVVGSRTAPVSELWS